MRLRGFDKHPGSKRHREERVNWASLSRSQSLTEDTGLELTEEQRWEPWKWFALPVLCLAAFLTQPKTTCQGVGWALLHQPSIKTMPHGHGHRPLSDLGHLSVEILFSQVTLNYVNLMIKTDLPVENGIKDVLTGLGVLVCTSAAPHRTGADGASCL